MGLSNLKQDNIWQYESLKQQLDDILEYEVRRSILWSLSENYEDGEKCTTIFFSLEKHKSKEKTFTKCRRGNNYLSMPLTR